MSTPLCTSLIPEDELLEYSCTSIKNSSTLTQQIFIELFHVVLAAWAVSLNKKSPHADQNVI